MVAPSFGDILPGSIVRFGHEVAVREGRAFHYQDDPCREAFFLLEGTVRAVKFTSSGKPFDLPPINRGEWFGIAELVSGCPCLFDAVACEPCRALSFSGVNLERAMRDDLAARTVREALARCVVSAHRVIAGDDAGGKVLSFLLSRRSVPGLSADRSCLRLTQASIAESVGLSRETVNRLLRELEELGLVSTGRGEIGIPDWDSLASYAGRRNT